MTVRTPCSCLILFFNPFVIYVCMLMLWYLGVTTHFNLLCYICTYRYEVMYIHSNRLSAFSIVHSIKSQLYTVSKKITQQCNIHFFWDGSWHNYKCMPNYYIDNHVFQNLFRWSYSPSLFSTLLYLIY